ncbi:MAG: hypothetical protein OEV93_04245 [Candidatus Moranbacteria bacterium]|nr:hypothetical protein [Candidatus Moranbacteria bacterium]
MDSKNASKSFSFKDLLNKSIKSLPERSQNIMKMRFGLNGKKYTLNKIGNEYNITRERVRQIIKESVGRVCKEDLGKIVSQAEEKIKFTITENSGIMTEDKLLNSLGNSEQEKGAIEFFLECSSDINLLEKKNEIKRSFVVSKFNVDKWRKVNKNTKAFLDKNKQTLSDDEFFEKIKDILKSKCDISKEEFLNYLESSEDVKKNNFGKWGLSKWSEISPKGARQKAYLVMREIGKPLHFREVADLIDEYKLSKRKSHPQTVHNELIKDKKFVLIGRGVYALSEWGYEKGTVKDVIEDILKKNKKPMNKNEILTQALAVRKVKRSTIVINLNNFFEKVEEDTYSIRDNKKNK